MLCNVCNSCNTRNTCNPCYSYANPNRNNNLCAGLWNLLLGNCISANNNDTANTGGNGCGCCCCCHRQNFCQRNRCGGNTYCATNVTSTNTEDLYYAYQYGLIPRNGGVCGGNTTNTYGCGCAY